MTYDDTFKTCACCGKKFYVGVVEEWCYKRKHGNHNDKTAWFCTWKCLRKWEADRDAKKSMRPDLP